MNYTPSMDVALAPESIRARRGGGGGSGGFNINALFISLLGLVILLAAATVVVTEFGKTQNANSTVQSTAFNVSNKGGEGFQTVGNLLPAIMIVAAIVLIIGLLRFVGG